MLPAYDVQEKGPYVMFGQCRPWSVCISAGWSGPSIICLQNQWILLYMSTNRKWPDKTAQISPPIWTYIVRKLHKVHCASYVILSFLCNNQNGYILYLGCRRCVIQSFQIIKILEKSDLCNILHAIWASAWQNLKSDLWDQQRLQSICISIQYGKGSGLSHFH